MAISSTNWGQKQRLAASPSEVSSDQLDLHLRAYFGFENVSEVPHFVGSASHKLIKVDKLRHFSISGA